VAFCFFGLALIFDLEPLTRTFSSAQFSVFADGRASSQEANQCAGALLRFACTIVNSFLLWEADTPKTLAVSFAVANRASIRVLVSSSFRCYIPLGGIASIENLFLWNLVLSQVSEQTI
jgi:hypothetical protein